MVSMSNQRIILQKKIVKRCSEELQRSRKNSNPLLTFSVKKPFLEDLGVW